MVNLLKELHILRLSAHFKSLTEAGFISDHQLQILPLLRYEKSIELRRKYKHTLVLRIKFEILNERLSFHWKEGKSHTIRKIIINPSLSYEGKLNSLEYTPKWPPGYGRAQWLVRQLSRWEAGHPDSQCCQSPGDGENHYERAFILLSYVSQIANQRLVSLQGKEETPPGRKAECDQRTLRRHVINTVMVWVKMSQPLPWARGNETHTHTHTHSSMRHTHAS